MPPNPYAIPNHVVRDDRKEKFDALQWRCNADPIYAPTLAEIRTIGVEEGQWRCQNSDCLHVSERFKLTRYWSGLKVDELKKRQTCGRCWGRRMKLQIFLP